MAHEITTPLWAEIVPAAPYPMSYEQFDSLPDGQGWRYELARGRAVRMPAPGKEHARIQKRIMRVLDAFVEQRGLGEVLGRMYFRLPLPGETGPSELAPDVVFLAKGRGAVPGTPDDEQPEKLAPDLAVEIADATQSRPEMASKANEYLHAGTRMVWVVYPYWQEIDVWHPGRSPETLSAKQQLEGKDVLPGFTHSVADFFPDLNKRTAHSKS